MNPVKLTLEQMRDKVAGAQALLDEVFHGLGDFDAAIQTTESGDSLGATDQGNGGSSSAAVSAAPAASLVPLVDKPSGTIRTPSRPFRVAIIVGHEPGAPGAVNPGTRESEYAFNSKLLPLILERVALIGRGLIVVERVFRHPEGYSKLPAKVNALKVDCAIELHANNFDGTATGTEMICLPDSKEAMRLASLLQGEVLKELGLADRKVKGPWAGRGEPLLRGTRMPCVIVEPFFIDNETDYRRALARMIPLAAAYARALAQYADSCWQRGLWK